MEPLSLKTLASRAFVGQVLISSIPEIKLLPRETKKDLDDFPVEVLRLIEQKQSLTGSFPERLCVELMFICVRIELAEFGKILNLNSDKWAAARSDGCDMFSCDCLRCCCCDKWELFKLRFT